MSQTTPRPLAQTLLLVALALTGATPALAQNITDPVGDGGESKTDLVRLVLQRSPQGVDVLLTTAAAYDFPNTQLLLDTDNSAATGFALEGAGFDLLIEGAVVNRFHGDDQTAWSWQPAGSVAHSPIGSKLRVSIPSKHVPQTKFKLLARTLSSSYDEIDRLPDAGTLAIDLAALGAATSTTRDAAETVDPPNDSDDASRDLVKLAARQDGQMVELVIETRAAGKFDQLLVFFDADHDGSTGYRSSHVVGRGFDFVLNGGRLHEFVGADQAVWAWSAVGEATLAADGKSLRASFHGGLLKSHDAQFVAMMMSADWQTVIDMAPDSGALRLKLDDTIKPPVRKNIKTAKPRPNRDDPPRTRFAAADSFYCYYGSGRVAELSHYDIVIAHSPQMRPADIATLKKLGVVMVGYITVGEDDKLREGDGTGPGGQASWYFDEDHDNQPDQNPIWKSYYANAADKGWQADRLAEAKCLIHEEGYDGIFLDTLDTASAFPQSHAGMVALVKSLRDNLPEAPIVLNQGYPLLPELAPLADGMMIESFTATYDFQNKQYVMHSPSSLDWTRGVAEKRIKPAIDQLDSFKVLVLDYALPTQLDHIKTAADRAATFGYLFAAGPITLDDVYHNDIVGEPDPRWLERQAKPETMRLTLAKPTNGFPAGTTITPSGCYGGYSVKPIVDGKRERDGMFWAEAAWASAEDGDAPWLEVRWPKTGAGGKLRIQWASDGGRVHASRRYRVEVQRDGVWHTVLSQQNNADAVSTIPLPDKPFDAVRLSQPADGGHKTRPNLMWIGQIEWIDEPAS